MSTVMAMNGAFYSKDLRSSQSSSSTDKHGVQHRQTSSTRFDFDSAAIDIVAQTNQPIYFDVDNAALMFESLDSSCSSQSSRTHVNSRSSTSFDDSAAAYDDFSSPTSPWELLVERQIRNISDADQTGYQQKKLATRQSSELFQTVMSEFRIDENENEDINSDVGQTGGADESESTEGGLKSGSRLIVNVGSVGDMDEAKRKSSERFAWRSRSDALTGDSRRFLYDRYIRSPHSWSDGLTKTGKEVLTEVRTKKKCLHRVQTAPSFGTLSTAHQRTKARPAAHATHAPPPPVLRSASTSNFRSSSSTSLETNSS